MIQTVFCKPQVLQGHCHFHPATEVTGNGVTAFPETSEATSKFFVCPFHSTSSSCMSRPASSWSMNPTVCPFWERATSKAGQGPAGGTIPTCLWKLNAIPQISDKILVFTVLRIKNRNKTCNDCKHWFLSTENCMCQETAARVHQLQWTHQQSSFLELLQNSVSDWFGRRPQTLISAITGEWGEQAQSLLLNNCLFAYHYHFHGTNIC